MLTGGVMGLAIHDLPLVRRFAPDFRDVEVLHAQTVLPFGYVISLRAGAVTIELRAAMNGTWEPSWTFEAIGDGRTGRHRRRRHRIPAGFLRPGRRRAGRRRPRRHRRLDRCRHRSGP